MAYHVTPPAVRRAALAKAADVEEIFKRLSENEIFLGALELTTKSIEAIYHEASALRGGSARDKRSTHPISGNPVRHFQKHTHYTS